jgi:transposase
VVFAAIVYVLVSGWAWRSLPPCFGISKSTVHRRFLIWFRAGVWGRLHEAVLRRLDDAGLLDVSRVILDTAHGRAKRGGAEHTGPSPVGRGKAGSKTCVLSDANGLPLLVGVSAGNVHDSEGLEPMVEDH